MTPTRYVLDTQLYVDILRGTPSAAATLQFLAQHVAAVDFHALVGAELLFGAADATEATAIRQRLIDRFKPNRLLIPDAAELLLAGDVIRALRHRDGPHPEHERRNFWNDVVIAVTCRQRGRVLISRDQDHGRIAPVVKHQLLTTVPALP